MFLSFVNYFAIQCFPDTYNLVREGPNIDPHVTDLMVHAKKILGHEGRCERGSVYSIFGTSLVSLLISKLHACLTGFPPRTHGELLGE